MAYLLYEEVMSVRLYAFMERRAIQRNQRKYEYSESVFNTLYIGIKHLLKKCPSEKVKGTKNALFFLSQAPITFDLRFLYELKHKVRLSETVCGFFHF